MKECVSSGSASSAGAFYHFFIFSFFHSFIAFWCEFRELLVNIKHRAHGRRRSLSAVLVVYCEGYLIIGYASLAVGCLGVNTDG